MQIRKHFHFESAHVLPYHAGKCARMHGHSYRLEVAVGGPLQTSGSSSGMVEDFETIKAIVRQHAVDKIDHQILNDFVQNPTAELVVLWIWDALIPHLPGLEELVLWETPNSCAVVRKGDASTR